MPQRSSLGDGPGLRYRCVLSCDPDHAARLSSNHGQSEDRQGCYRRRDIKSGSTIKAIERLVQILHRGPFQDARAAPSIQMDSQTSPLRVSLRGSSKFFIDIKNHPHLHHGIIVIYIEATSTILIYIAPVARRIKYATFPQRHPAEGSQLTNKLLSVGETRGLS